MALKHWFCNPFMQDDVIFDAHKKAFHQHMNNPFSKLISTINTHQQKINTALNVWQLIHSVNSWKRASQATHL